MCKIKKKLTNLKFEKIEKFEISKLRTPESGFDAKVLLIVWRFLQNEYIILMGSFRPSTQLSMRCLSASIDFRRPEVVLDSRYRIYPKLSNCQN